jgi:hypothetical protein
MGSVTQTSSHRPKPAGLPLEVVVVWFLFAIVAVEIAVTYWRLDTERLYHVSGSGIEGGASRVLVFLNFPVALVAIAILLLLVERLDRRLRTLAVAGIVLSAAVFWPGVVDPRDLDARPVNAIAACGVVVGIVITGLVWLAEGRERSLDRSALALRAAIAAVALAIAVPWIAAESGASFAGVPVLGTLYQTSELRTEPGDPIPHRAVHAGHHHGMDGVLLVWSALLLVPLVARIGAGSLRAATTAYVSLMLTYGAAEIANDAWLEQIAKRGWTSRTIPDTTEPRLSLAWGVIVLAAVALTVVLVVGHARERPETAS